MRKAWFILVALLPTNYAAYALTVESIAPIILNESMLDSVTAGAISSITTANAFAVGSTYAKTMTDVTDYAIARPGNLQSTGQGVAVAHGNDLAVAGGASVSNADTTGVSVAGVAVAVGGDAYTSVWTKAIDTRNAEIAIGHVRSVACCGPDTYTSVQASTFTQQDSNAGHITLHDVNTPHSSHSIGNAVIVSISHP